MIRNDGHFLSVKVGAPAFTREDNSILLPFVYGVVGFCGGKLTTVVSDGL